jgi:hypothetical protein
MTTSGALSEEKKCPCSAFERIVRLGGLGQRSNHRQVRLVFVTQLGDEADIRIGLEHVWQMLDLLSALLRRECGFRLEQGHCVLDHGQSSADRGGM